MTIPNFPDYVFTRNDLRCYFFEGPITSEDLKELLILLVQTTNSAHVKGAMKIDESLVSLDCKQPELAKKIVASFATHTPDEVLPDVTFIISDHWEVFASTPAETYVVGIISTFSSPFRVEAKQKGFDLAALKFDDYMEFQLHLSNISHDNKINDETLLYHKSLRENYAHTSFDL